MKFEVRMYKIFDTDLAALFHEGFPVKKMLQNALTAYARGEPLYYLAKSAGYYDIKNKKKSCRIKMETQDSEVIRVLSSIKPMSRNSFLKCLLRNTLVQQNLNCYFENMDNESQDKNYDNKLLITYPNLKIVTPHVREISDFKTDFKTESKLPVGVTVREDADKNNNTGKINTNTDIDRTEINADNGIDEIALLNAFDNM